MSLHIRSKPERKHKASFIIPYKKTSSVVPIANNNHNGSNNEYIDVNQIRLSFQPDRKFTLKSLGNYLRHTRGSQIHNQSATRIKPRGGKKNKKTEKRKSRKNRTKRRKLI